MSKNNPKRNSYDMTPAEIAEYRRKVQEQDRAREEWAKENLLPYQIDYLTNTQNIPLRRIENLNVQDYQRQVPGLFGLPDVQIVTDPSLRNSNTSGYVISRGFENLQGGKNETMFVKPTQQWSNEPAKTNPKTVAHEGEHLLARRGLGSATGINRLFDLGTGEGVKKTKYDTPTRSNLVKAIADSRDYLRDTYGTESAYFSPDFVKQTGGNILYEQFAELGALEAVHGVDLTKDPELRKTVFKDKKVRELFRSMVGLRQSRLDAKDLTPYTQYDETTGQNITYEQAKAKDAAYNNSLVGRLNTMLGGAPDNTASLYRGRYEREVPDNIGTLYSDNPLGLPYRNAR